MDFGLSDDQKLLDTSVRDFLADRAPITRVRDFRELDCPNDRELWKDLASLGAAGILVPEEHGGSGLGLLDAAIVAQALGHAATPTPFLSTAVLAPIALAGFAPQEAGAWLKGIAKGDLIVGTALTETFSAREDAGLRLENDTIYGKSLMAIDAHGADLILLALGKDRLAIVSANAPGLTVTRLTTIDATRCTAEVICEGVRPEAIHSDAEASLLRTLEAGRIALAADELGACESMIEQAVAYAKEREQFDRPIASFQAVKHMCAEMIAEMEPARSLLWYAAHTFDALPDESPLMACHVLAHVSEIGRHIASVATQVHGGTGWTDEQNLHFWFKRIGVARHLLGSPEFLRERAATLQGLDAGA